MRSQSQANRAQWAWSEVSAVKPDDDEYRTEALKLPARLLTSGLGQTMAFLHARAKGQFKEELTEDDPSRGAARLYSQLARRVQAVCGKKEPPMEIIVKLGVVEYRVLGREMLETAEWIKRFAEGQVVSKGKRAKQPQGGRT
jgi:CRISPR type III-B/RAMP module-associated protein Cmr5